MPLPSVAPVDRQPVMGQVVFETHSTTLDSTSLEDLASRDFAWQPGWEYLVR